MSAPARGRRLPAPGVRMACVTALALLATLFPVAMVYAANCTYVGPVAGGSWHNATNWDCGHVPGSGDQASIPSGLDVALAADATVGTLAMAGGFPPMITFSGEAILAAGAFFVDQARLQGTGTLTVAGTFAKSTNGTLFISDSVDLVLNGPGTHQGGTITICTLNAPAPGDMTLQINDTFTIVDGTSVNPFDCTPPGAPIHVNPGGHLIKTGGGQKTSQTAIDNDGTITAQEGTFVLSGGSGHALGATSDGTYLAEAGAELQFHAGPPLIGGSMGGGGTIHINALDMQLLAGATLDPQVFQLTGSVWLLGADPVDLPVFNLTGGTLESDRPVTAHVMNVTGGTLQRDFTLTVAADGSFSKTTGGAFFISQAGAEATAADLVLDANATLDGGQICVNANGAFTDWPNLHINRDFTIGAGASTAAFPCGGVTHVNGPTGHVHRAGSGTTNFGGALDVAGGTVTVGTGQTFQLDHGITLTGGGVLSGAGQITGSVTNTGGTVRPGASPGTLFVTGNYTQGPGATLEVDVNGTAQGTQYDHLAVGGAASLDGTLAVVQGAGFDPQESDTFQFLTSASRTGTFASLTGATLPSGKTYSLDYPGAPDFGARLLVQPAPPNGDVIVTNCDDPALATLAAVAGDLIVENLAACTGLSLPSLTQVAGNLVISGNPSMSNLDLGSLTDVTGNVTITENGSTGLLDLGSLTAVAGNLTITDNGSATVTVGADGGVVGNLTLQSTGAGNLDLGSNDTTGTLILDLTGYDQVRGATGGGDTSVSNATAEAVMHVTLPDATFDKPVSFTITHLDPSTLAPEAGTGADGNPATVDGIAAYQFEFGVPTLGVDATLTFEILLDGLDQATRDEFLAALAAGNATLATHGDDPGATYQAFPICAGADVPTAAGCVLVETLDANGQPTTGAPKIVRFTGVTDHFSTWAVAVVEAVTDDTPPIIDPHADITVEATGPDGTVVDYIAPAATDAVDGPVSVSCSPPSGSLFAAGPGGLDSAATLVSCGASDAHGNSAHPVTFEVTVLGARDQLTGLSASVRASSIPRLSKGVLMATLKIALWWLSRDRPVLAYRALELFVSVVRIHDRSGRIPSALAAEWIGSARQIEHVIGY